MKKVLLTLFFSIMLGILLGIYSYNKFNKEDLSLVMNKNNEIYAFQIGVFDNLDNANNLANKYNAIVLNDNNKYRVYIAFCTTMLNKLKDYYDKKAIAYYIRNINVSSTFFNKLKEYELLLSEANTNNYDSIIKKILNEYEEDLNEN